MFCLVCRAWWPPDGETGYDADGICPECESDGWYEDADTQLRNDNIPTDEDE